MMDIRQIKAEDVWPIRHQVMWPDKKLDYVFIPGDEAALHFGLFIENKLVSVISLFQEGENAQFRKFATLESEQGKGYGTQLLNYLLDFVEKDVQITKVWCNARIEKAGYYQKFGLRKTKHTFEKGGKAYLIMEKYLRQLSLDSPLEDSSLKSKK